MRYIVVLAMHCEVPITRTPATERSHSVHVVHRKMLSNPKSTRLSTLYNYPDPDLHSVSHDPEITLTFASSHHHTSSFCTTRRQLRNLVDLEDLFNFRALVSSARFTRKERLASQDQNTLVQGSELSTRSSSNHLNHPHPTSAPTTTPSKAKQALHQTPPPNPQFAAVQSAGPGIG